MLNKEHNTLEGIADFFFLIAVHQKKKKLRSKQKNS